MKSTARKSDPDRLRLFLRIKHPTMDPAEITRVLEIEPEHTTIAGLTVTPRGVKKLHSESYWLAELAIQSICELAAGWRTRMPSLSADAPGSSVPASALMRMAQSAGLYDLQIITWLKRLEGHSEFVKQLIQDGGRITLVMQGSDRNAPLNIGPALSRRLADLEIALEID